MPETVKHVSDSVKISPAARDVPRVTLMNCGRSVVENWRVPMRTLPLWHLWWNLSAGGRLILSDREIKMKPDLIYLLPGNTGFATTSDAGIEQIFCDFYLESEYFSHLRKEPVTFPIHRYEAFLKKFRDEKFSALALNALILLLLDDIPPSCFGREDAFLPDPRIRKALNIITEAFRKRPTPKLDNGQLSRELGMSEVNFIHLFKREMKMPPQRYIMHKRLEFARDLLHNNTISIEHISYITGFSDRYHFTRAFSRRYGLSPGACRKKMQSAEK
ncbi:MAG: helix-turn-helix transcriptional regulator [Lentisphaeria bacterium]|nr:helix-turn-helix transcriptional regulator [Lentisphaeria bacterium]